MLLSALHNHTHDVPFAAWALAPLRNAPRRISEEEDPLLHRDLFRHTIESNPEHRLHPDGQGHHAYSRLDQLRGVSVHPGHVYLGLDRAGHQQSDEVARRSRERKQSHTLSDDRTSHLHKLCNPAALLHLDRYANAGRRKSISRRWRQAELLRLDRA